VDAMLQASGVLSNDVNSRSFAGIPKGFKTLKVYTAMQENMLVYTKLTKMTRKNSYYTSILCTEKGTIVAEMTDLIIRTMDTSIPNDYISYDLNWFKHEMSQDFMWKDTDMNNEVMIVFGSKRFKRWISKGNFSFTFHEIPDDQNKFKQVATEVLRHCKKGQKLVFAPCMNCNDILDLVNVDVYNIIKSNANSLKTIFNIKQSSVDTTPVFVVTEMTQQLSPKLQEKTNFLGAELWGFTRSAMTEMPSEDIRLIDVDLQEESIQPFVSLVVNTENIVLESLIRNGYIYGNEIRPSITQDIATIQTSISECSTPISLYSNSSDGVSDPFLAAANRILEKNGVQGDNVNIKVSTVYINRNDMMTTKSSISFFSSNPGIEIKTNEFVGWIQRGKKEDRNLKKDDDIYVVCFPVTVSTVLTVPTSCCLNLKDTPFYTPGLISETVILWKIRKQVKPNSNALIVVSDTNCWRAKILSRLFEYHKSKGKIASWQELTSLSTNERYSHAVVLQFENTSNICMLNSIIGLQNVICVNSWLPWDAASFFMQNIVHADVLTLRSENILSEKCCMKLVPKVLKYLKTDSDFFEKTLPRELTEGSLSVISVLYSSVDVQSISMETKIPVILYPSSCFKKDGYYIFVGGTSGLGWELLQYCAQLGAGNLVTFSRRGLTKEKKTEMERIESLYRCNIQHIRADITDIDSLQNGFNILRNKNAKVKGIFNGAGVLKDTLLNKMTTEDLETVLRPKVLGTLNLHRVSKDFALDYFVTHSSITAIFGNPGQCNYAAGNSFQDSFAFFRSSHGLCAQSINWGALQVGMARESGPDFENRFRRQGIHILNDKDVRTCFNEIVLTKDIQKMFGIFDWQRFIQNPIYTSAHYKFRRILQETGLIQQEKPIQSSDIILRDDFHKLPSEKKKENLTNVIQLTLTESLMVEKESLLPGTSLYKLGIDSMSAMSISNCLHQYTSIRVPVVFLLSNTTSIEGLVSFLLRELEARGVDENTLEEEPINYDILDGSVTFMQGSILNCLDTDKPENFIRSICYEVKLKRTSVRKWVQIITTLLNLHPGLRQIFFWDPVEKRFQAKEIEINKFNVPIDIVSFENIFEQSNPEQLDPRNHIPVKFHLACKERTTRMKLFLHAVVVDMQSINVLFRDLEICARHYFLGEELPDIQQNHVAETVRLALTPMFKDMQSFWKRQFSLSVEPFSFSSYELKTLQEENWREIGHVFSDDQFDNIISFTRNEKITLYNCVLSVYFLCIHELTGREYIPLITNTNIRGFIPALENVLSRCINEVPVIGRVQSKITISQYLQEMALQLNMVTEHGAYPFELIRQDIKSENLQQNIGRHRFIIDDISNVSMQSVKKDVTVKVTAVRHRRHNYETCLFVYHNMKGKTLSLDLGFNSESFSMSRAHLMLGRLEFLMNQLTSCDLSISVEELLWVENKSLDIITDCKKNQTKETFVFEDFLSKSTSHTNISNRFTEKSRKNTEMSHGSTKTIMLGMYMNLKYMN
jgi:NAD(P)-dependent dehydrogenase (short-subunit alcohol dehydrogenase family)